MKNPVAAELQPVFIEMAGLCTSKATGNDPWTATSLLSAFIELAIAFLFLAGATITYFTSKFIKTFGLHLPCFDRGGEWIERQSEVRRSAFYNRLSNELCALSHCLLHRTFIEDRNPCNQSSPLNTGSEQGWNSLEPMRLNQLSFHCTSHRPQMRCHCVWHPYSEELKTTISDDATALRSQTQCKNDAFLFNGHLVGCKFSCQRRCHKQSGKRALCSLSIVDRVSDDDGIIGLQKEGALPEVKNSLKVFPEECMDYKALIQGHERNGVIGHPRALGKFASAHNLSVRAEWTQPLERSPNQSPFEPENVRDKFDGFSAAQICGGVLPAEPARDIVEEECACNSSDFPRREQEIEQKSEDTGESVAGNLSDNDARMETSGLVITGYGRPKSSSCQTDNDTLKLKQQLAAEREVLYRTYLELEKERNASASAAEEAMGLITRLQEDKATLQMEAVQYQRIAEERAMFDEEAIVALRDILLKREAEKLALEKEIELYKRKLLVGGQHGDLSNHNPSYCSPETVKDAYYEDHQIDDSDTFHDVQSSAPTVALASFRNQSEGTKRKFESSAEIQCQHVLSRIWRLEEQISGLRTKYNMTLEQPLNAVSSQFNTNDLVQLRLSNERRETLGCQNFKHGNSAANRSTSGKDSGARQPGRRIIRAKSEACTSLSIPKRCNMNGNRTVSCEIDSKSNYSRTLELSEDNLTGNEICSEMGDQLSMPDTFFGAVVTHEEAQVQEKQPLETASPSFCFPLEKETVLADENGVAIDNDVNEISTYSSPGDFSDSQTSSIIMSDRYRNIVQQEMKKLMYRLEMVEADRGLMRQATDSIRKGMEGMEQLLDMAQQLRLLLASEGMVRAPENP